MFQLTTGKQENLTKDNKIINTNNTKDDKDLKSSFLYRKDLLFLSDNEKKQHNNFLAEMKDPMWKKLID